MTRAAGILLFLPVPVVLFLFTRAPLGPWTSLGLGVGLMVTHRLYARPFALAHAEERCLWCAGAAAGGPRIAVDEPFGTTAWRACRPAHAERVARVLGWASRRRTLLKVGILGTLVVFLLASVWAAIGRAGAVRFADGVAFFRLGIASTVLPLGLAAPRAKVPPDAPLRPPFPVHIQALIGTWAVMWLFRLVGLTWLVLGVWHVVTRLGLAGS